MGFFKKVIKAVTKVAVAPLALPIVAVVATTATVAASGYLANKTRVIAKKEIRDEWDRGDDQAYAQKTPAKDNIVMAPQSPCSSIVPENVAKISAENDVLQKRISMFQSGINRDNPDNAFKACANSSAGKIAREQVAAMRPAIAYCASDLDQQTRNLNQTKQIHDQFKSVLGSGAECEALLAAVNQLVPPNAGVSTNACQILPAVAEISADADRVWEGMQKLIADVTKAQMEDSQPSIDDDKCRLSARMRRQSSSMAECSPVAPNPTIECVKAANLNGPLNKLRSINRKTVSCRSNYDQEYNDLVQVKEYEASLRLAMSGKRICDQLARNLVNTPIPERHIASGPFAEDQKSTCQGTRCAGHSSSASAVK